MMAKPPMHHMMCKVQMIANSHEYAMNIMAHEFLNLFLKTTSKGRLLSQIFFVKTIFLVEMFLQDFINGGWFARTMKMCRWKIIAVGIPERSGEDEAQTECSVIKQDTMGFSKSFQQKTRQDIYSRDSMLGIPFQSGIQNVKSHSMKMPGSLEYFLHRKHKPIRIQVSWCIAL